jgi:hypothetical protein
MLMFCVSELAFSGHQYINWRCYFFFETKTKFQLLDLKEVGVHAILGIFFY